MQQKNLLILSLVTLVALAVAALALRDKGDTSAATPGLLFPDLGEHINDVTELRVEKDGQVLTLKKEGGQWKLADRGGYPAQFEKVKDLAMGLANLEVEETKTAKKENHKTLGVEWPTPAPAEGAEREESDAGLVTLKDAGGKELASVVLGRTEYRGSKPKVYARRASEDQVYLCAPRAPIGVMASTKDWIDSKFLELANDRVQDVTIEHADGERVEVARSATNHTQFKVQGLAPGQNERYEGVATPLAQALGNGLTLDDVRPVAEVDFTTEPVAKTRYRCVDGLELVLESAKFEDKTWVRATASYVPPPEPAEPEPPADDAVGEGDQAEPKPEKKDVAKEVADLNARLAPWAYQVPQYRVDALTRRLSDLLAVPAPAEGTPEENSLQGLMDDIGYSNDEPAPETAPAPKPDPDMPVEPVEPKDDEGAAPPPTDAEPR